MFIHQPADVYSWRRGGLLCTESVASEACSSADVAVVNEKNPQAAASSGRLP